MMLRDDRMSSTIRPRKWLILCIFITIPLLGYLWFYPSCHGFHTATSFTTDSVYSVWPQFTTETVFTQEYFDERCFRMTDMSIAKLDSFVKEWGQSSKSECRDLYQRFAAMFSVSKRQTPLILPNPFKAKVKNWLGNNEELFQQVYKQEVTHVFNRVTREYNIFNPLRDKRPMKTPAEPERQYVERLIVNSRESCDFCNYKNFTAEHETHRLESSMSYTASNTFKMEKWHALFMFKKHHPLNWNREEFIDLMKLSQKWFHVAHKRDPAAKYRVMVWDIFPHAGASQIHPHVHGFLSPHLYHGVVEAWREGAEEYYRRYNNNYFTDLVSVYSAMGLTVTHGAAVAIASIVPKKDHEVIILSPTPGDSFFQLIYYTLRAFIDDIDKLCFSMGIGLPPLGSDLGSIPAYARIVTRGAVADVRTDMSSLELFAGTNVNIDPYKVIKLVHASVQSRHTG
ncbi:uncharacterized protein [Haliotis cracherodii]|uniref:uncharacterized protein n=1 Tax=Haliotis cracherodii TaxID=6455 RepID=UPI0039EBC811